MICMVPSGWLAYRLGGALVLGIAVLWWSIFTILTPLATFWGLPILLATRIAMGAGESAMFPAAYNLYSRWVPEKERSRAVSLLVGGIPMGTLFALISTGWIVEKFGWESVFYIFGLTGVLWFAIWQIKGHNDPKSDPRCLNLERELLCRTEISDEASSIKGTQNSTGSADQKKKVPWIKFFKSAPVWALIINHFCTNWGFYMLLAWLPSYFKTTLNLTLINAGIYAAAPWLTMFLVGLLGGYIADKLLFIGISLKRVRKTMQILGLLGSATCFWAAQDATSTFQALSLMCGALGLIALTWTGFLPNHLEIAPKYADVLMGITNTAGTVPGIIGITITGWLIDQTGNYGSAFALCAAMNVVGAVTWALFADTEEIIN